MCLPWCPFGEEPSGADVDVSASMSCRAGGHSVDSVTALTSSLLTAANQICVPCLLHHVYHDPLHILCLPPSCEFSLVPEKCRRVPVVQGLTFS